MFKLPDIVDIVPPTPKSIWNISQPIIENEEEKKRQFGVLLGKFSPFKAACEIFGEDTNAALFISHNWIIDPVVVAAKDKYLEAADTSQVLLDKSQLARKFLNMAEEKNPSNTFYILDGKDRLKALELYAKINGYLDDKNNQALTQNFVHNSMTIKLVEAEKKEQKITTIDNEDKIQNTNSPLKLKLVG